MLEEKKFFVWNGVIYKVYVLVDLSKCWYVYYCNNGKWIRYYGDIKKYFIYSIRMVVVICFIEEFVIFCVF